MRSTYAPNKFECGNRKKAVFENCVDVIAVDMHIVAINQCKSKQCTELQMETEKAILSWMQV